jgi:hypothetical protein
MKALRLVLVLARLAPFCIVAAASPVLAQTAPPAPSPQTLQAAKDLVAIINKGTLEQLATQVTSQVWPQIKRGLQAKNPTISAAVLAELRGEFVRVQLEFITHIMDDAPVIYARHFTEAELQELLAYHRSPIGQKAIRELPQIMAETMAVIMPRMPQVQAQVMEAFTKVLRQRGINI